MQIRSKLLLCCVLMALSACSGSSSSSSSDDPNAAPQDDIMRRQARNGSITGSAGITLLGRKEDGSAGGGIGVNSFLWRATLDTLSFMPLSSADPFGGVIITDWYEDPKIPGERFKVNALILDKTLRADGVKITVFKQKLVKGVWRDETVKDNLEQSLEDTVLTRARQLRVEQLGKT